MSFQDHAIPFGMRECVIVPYTNGNATILGVPQKLPASQTFTWKDSESFENLRGDDRTYASRGGGPEVSWDLEAGGISLAAWAILSGGNASASGASPDSSIKVERTETSVRPYFLIQGRAISDSGGDLVVTLPKCRCTGSVDGSFGDGKFFITKASGEAFGSSVELTEYDVQVGTVSIATSRETAAVLLP